MPKKQDLKSVPAPKFISQEVIRNMIFLIRGRKVMLDSDLANLYQVTTGRLNEQVKRNIKRFPDDFMFQLSHEEFGSLISQFAISNRGGRRKLPFAFTEQGVAMLSGVLHSDRAVAVNIEIMRAFTQLRRMLLTNVDLRRKIAQMERTYDKQFQVVFTALNKLFEEPKKPKGKLGF